MSVCRFVTLTFLVALLLSACGPAPAPTAAPQATPEPAEPTQVPTVNDGGLIEDDTSVIAPTMDPDLPTPGGLGFDEVRDASFSVQFFGAFQQVMPPGDIAWTRVAASGETPAHTELRISDASVTLRLLLPENLSLGQYPLDQSLPEMPEVRITQDGTPFEGNIAGSLNVNQIGETLNAQFGFSVLGEAQLSVSGQVNGVALSE